MKREQPVATTLPADVRYALVEAARSHPRKLRALEIERVIERARSKYPHLFKQESEQ